MKWAKCLQKYIQFAENSNRFYIINKTTNYHYNLAANYCCQANETEVKTKWEAVIGLEIHAQINSVSKLFSNSATIFGAPTNTQVSYFDAALPGTMPVLNKYCVEAAILTALALNCTIHKTFSFDRKHYFYSDLPAGYQITQQFHPLASDGYLEFCVHDREYGIEPYDCRVKLKQIQLEQDSGRSFHVEGRQTLVDLNRAGIGLMELVFEPDLKNGREAAMMVKELQLILKKLGTCTCNMEEGALRVDANISVHKTDEPWGVRTEVKNINSNRFIANAIDYEIERQIRLIEDGGIVVNETRSYDFKTKKTVYMRDKEVFQDYRFYPEPNLPPLRLCDDSDDINDPENVINIDQLRRKMPNLPSEDRDIIMKTYNLNMMSADRLVSQEGLLDFFKSISKPEDNQGALLVFLTHKVQYQLNRRNLTFLNCPVTTGQLKEVFQLDNGRKISERTTVDILDMLFDGDSRSANEIVETYNWFLVTDEKELEMLCLQVIKERPKMAKKYRNTQQYRYMKSLIDGVNMKINNRACIPIAEAIFIKLIMSSTKN